MSDVLRWGGGALQVVGLVVALLGIAAVRSWLSDTADAAAQRRRGLGTWWAFRRERMSAWWAHRRGRSVSMQRSASDIATVSDSASVMRVRHRVDRQKISDRDWLVHLDDRVYGLYEDFDREVEARTALERRLRVQRAEMREEIRTATQDGWRLVVTGLVLSAVGTVLSTIA